MTELQGAFLRAATALEAVWVLREQATPLSDTGIAIQQCKAVQLQLLAIIYAERLDEKKVAGQPLSN